MNMDIQCIEVSTPRTQDGYGQSALWVGGRDYMMRAHRIAFERAWSITLKPGQVVMHTCDNPGCVNPLHLMLGTRLKNSQDMAFKGRARNRYMGRTHCSNGHEYTEANTRVNPRGDRACRACARDTERRAYHARR